MASFTLPTILCLAVLFSVTWAYDFYRGPCPGGWMYYNQRCFQYVAVKKNWIDAEVECLRRGGNLASVCCDEENDYFKKLQKHVGGHGPFWIGLSDVHAVRKWLWSDGSSGSYRKWNFHEPNNPKTEHCVHASFAGGNWNNIACGNPYEFICAKNLY